MTRLLGTALAVIATLGVIAEAQARPAVQPPGHMLAVTEAGNGSGTVTSGDGNISCPPTCSHFYISPAPVTVTATPAAGSAFSGWSGSCTGSAPTCTVDMASNQTVTATFTKPASPPPPAPSCSLHLKSTHVLLAAPKAKPALRKRVGKLRLTFGCDQTLSATLTVKVIEAVSHHHRVTFQLTRRYTLKAKSTHTYTLTLWRGALRGLKRHRHETITVSFDGSNANGGSAVGISARLTGVG